MNAFQKLRYNAARAQREQEKRKADADRRKEEARHRAENLSAREAIRAALREAREQKREAYDAEIDEALTPERERRMHMWLAEHPDHDEADFNAQAWPHLRKMLIEEAQAEEQIILRQRLLVGGDYF